MKVTIGQPYSFHQLGKRDNQEDARFPDEDKPQNPAPFFVVCDGVGGCEKGEVASNAVCKAFAKALAKTDWNGDFANDDFKVALNEAYDSLNDMANKDNADMATTLTFVCFHAGGCLVAHIGDSRIYHIRPNAGILYRSEDHSLVNALVHSGNLTPEEAERHPQSNVITRYIGITKDGQERSNATVMRITDIQAGDYFFLCSDGVLESVSDKTLLDILSMPMTDEEKMGNIARLCQDSHDNNTAYLIPIASVENDDEGEAEAVLAQSEGSDTSVFSKRQEQARDVAPSVEQTTQEKVVGFFKKLFGRQQ